jgi:hypothetical protein
METKWAEPFLTLPLPSSDYRRIHLLNLLLDYEERISPRNSACIFIYRYLKEEHIIFFQVLAEIYFPPIHNRSLAYSCSTPSSFRQHPNQLVPLFWVMRVKFISIHVSNAPYH